MFYNVVFTGAMCTLFVSPESRNIMVQYVLNLDFMFKDTVNHMLFNRVVDVVFELI